ncbi:hypothetical protein NHQ30_008336 [Ciborinia camelliae]|nr:hypothetical protein NHQ30_008336 [Ciborinia camelliae]
MPSLPINLPSAHAAATLFIRAINETQSISETDKPRNCTTAHDNPEYLSDECQRKAFRLFTSIITYGLLILMTVIVLILAVLILRKMRGKTMPESMEMEDLPENSPPPAYRFSSMKSTETLPVYEVEHSVDSVTLQHVTLPEAAVVRGNVGSRV